MAVGCGRWDGWPAALAAVGLALAGCGGPGEEAGPAGTLAGPADVEPLAGKSLDLGGGVRLELRRVPAGWVRIGSPESEPGRHPQEGPQRVEHFAEGFWIGTYEVTQAQWQQVMGSNPSRFRGEDRPVEWEDGAALVEQVDEFCRRVSRRTGTTVRLPTEAEWEYACRAPRETQRNTPAPPSLPAYSFGADAVALGAYGWVEQSDSQAHPVGKRAPNRFGLHDLHGNVAELCAEEFTAYPGSGAENANFGRGRRAARGGSWVSGRLDCRCATRDFFDPVYTANGTVGFRVVCGGE